MFYDLENLLNFLILLIVSLWTMRTNGQIRVEVGQEGGMSILNNYMYNVF